MSSVMASEASLAAAGLHFDLINDICILEPDVAEQTNQLKDGCKDFLEKMEETEALIESFKEIIDTTTAETEQVQLQAIATRGMLKSAVKQRKAQQQQLQALILERRIELDRLKTRQSSLLKYIQDTNDFTEQYMSQK